MITTTKSNFINVKGKLMPLSPAKIMGIVNLTADSFYDGGKIKTDKELLTKVDHMLTAGVDILDIGAYSSRPGALDIETEIELKNATEGIKTVLKEFPESILSVDTFRAKVAAASIDSGAVIINDISGGDLDDAMFDLVAERNVPYIMMHMRGTPQTMSKMTEYNDLTNEVIDYFNLKIDFLTERGVSDIIIDPGFGFAKTREQNFELLNKLELLSMLEMPILCGVSRKSMIFKTLDISAGEALNGSTALNMTCLMKGASILRVHDVKEAKEVVTLFESMTNS